MKKNSVISALPKLSHILLICILALGGLSLLNFKDSLDQINDISYLEKTIQGKKLWTPINSTLSKEKIDTIIKERQINYHMTRSFYLKEKKIDIFMSYSWTENKCMISAKSNTIYKKIGDWVEQTFPIDLNWAAYTHKKFQTKDIYCNLLFGYGQIVN